MDIYETYKTTRNNSYCRLHLICWGNDFNPYFNQPNMTPHEQLKALKQAVGSIEDPELLFEMNRKARELQQQISYINNLEINT